MHAHLHPFLLKLTDMRYVPAAAREGVDLTALCVCVCVFADPPAAMGRFGYAKKEMERLKLRDEPNGPMEV